VARIRTKAHSIAKAVAGFWGTLTKDMFDSYRPERHYMRGPGPKWREKHVHG
jgi:hypothetical protein